MSGNEEIKSLAMVGSSLVHCAAQTVAECWTCVRLLSCAFEEEEGELKLKGHCAAAKGLTAGRGGPRKPVDQLF